MRAHTRTHVSTNHTFQSQYTYNAARLINILGQYTRILCRNLAIIRLLSYCLNFGIKQAICEQHSFIRAWVNFNVQK